MRVGIEHEIGHARREARVDRLLEAAGVEGRADGVGPDDGDRLAILDGKNPDGLVGRDDVRVEVFGVFGHGSRFPDKSKKNGGWAPPTASIFRWAEPTLQILKIRATIVGWVYSPTASGP